MSKTSSEYGKVYLVGAGPGDPGLITLRGVECLSRAELLLYDYLVNPAILQHVAAGAEVICLGRHGRDRIWPQSEINATIVEAACAGKTVVRLKGGDPAVFARGAEEIEALASAGIQWEVVPGVTAGLAAGSYAGISVTHRDLASAVAFVTGQETPDKSEDVLDYGALAEFPGTLVIYMGVTTARRWTSALIAAGKSPQTPAAIVRNCSLPNQRSIRCSLSEVPDRLEEKDRLRPPVIVIVGAVAALDESLNWFEQLPLFGKTVLVTRPIHQVEAVAQPLRALGANVVVQSAIQISDPADWQPVDAALDNLGRYDWLVFSSSNGARQLLNRLCQRGGDMRNLAGVKLAAIGPGTAAELARFHLSADLQPEDFRAESLASALESEAADRRFLLARASRGREVLADSLNACGADVDQIVVYDSQDVATADPDVQTLMDDRQVDWITVTSSAIARSLDHMFGGQLGECSLASISPITTATLRELGLEPTVEAKTYTMDGVVEAILSVTQ